MARDFSDSQRNTIWRNFFGVATSGTDAFGRTVYFSNFQADHIWPYSNGGKTVVENGMPLSPLSNDEKSDDMSGFVNNVRFHVQGINSRGIINTSNGIYDYKGRR